MQHSRLAWEVLWYGREEIRVGEALFVTLSYLSLPLLVEALLVEGSGNG